MERFAGWSSDGTVDPAKNKYILNFSSIRTIQKFLWTKSDKYMIP